MKLMVIRLMWRKKVFSVEKFGTGRRRHDINAVHKDVVIWAEDGEMT